MSKNHGPTRIRTSDPTVRGMVFSLRSTWEWRVQHQIDQWNVEVESSGQALTRQEAIEKTYKSINSFFGDYVDPATGKSPVKIWTE